MSLYWKKLPHYQHHTLVVPSLYYFYMVKYYNCLFFCNDCIYGKLSAKFNPTYLLSCERVIYSLCSSASSICSDSPDPYWLIKAHIVEATITPYLSVITEGAAMGTERKHCHICSGCDYVGISGETLSAYVSPGSAHHTASGTSSSREVSCETTSHCWYSSHGLTAVWVVHLVVSHHEWAEAPLYDRLEEKGGRDILWEHMVGQQARRQCLLIW